MIKREKIIKHLHRPIPLEIYDEIDSTNTRAKQLAEVSSNCDMLIVAECQSEGRGRLGRSFYSPGGGLYMSLLLHPHINAGRAVHITTAAAVAVCRAIESFGEHRCTIKWVNDIYVNERKISGILAESKIDSDGTVEYTVLGVGINIVEPKDGFPDDIKDRAGALFSEADDDLVCVLAATVTNEFMSIYDGGLILSDYLDEYRQRSFLVGKNVNVISIKHGVSRPARAIAVDDSCSLVVKYDDGTVEAISSGEVSVIER